jgi:hypothetical protein
VALAACVVSMETQDQETAEQYYRIHGVYPSWYPYGVRAFPYTGYPAAAAYPGYYPSAAFMPAGVKNVITPYAAVYPYAYNAYPYGAIPYVVPAPAAIPAKV